MPIIQTNKELRLRDEADHYPTPYELVRAALGTIPQITEVGPLHILDPGAGTGVWGDELKKLCPDSCIIGVEMDVKHLPNPNYAHWDVCNFLETDYKPESVDLIVGNPPYGRNADGRKDRKLAEKFVQKSWEYLKPHGYMVFLLRMGFLEGQSRAKDFWPNYPLKTLYVLSRRPSFTKDFRTDATTYGLFIWQKAYRGPCYLDWLKWNYENKSPEQEIEQIKREAASRPVDPERQQRKFELLQVLENEGEEIRFTDSDDKALCEEMRGAGWVSRLVWEPGRWYYEITDKGREALAATRTVQA